MHETKDNHPQLYFNDITWKNQCWNVKLQQRAEEVWETVAASSALK
jgi:hypothetical protein